MWEMRSFGDSRTQAPDPKDQRGWPTREALARYVRRLGLLVARDGMIYAPARAGGRRRSPYAHPIGEIAREGDAT